MGRLLYVILSLTAAAVFLAGCGTNQEAAHLYQMEKLYYQAEREVSLVSIGPGGPETADRTRIAELYGEVVDYYQGVREEFQGDTLSEDEAMAGDLAIQSSLRMAALLAPTDQAARAIKIYRDIPRDFPRLPAYHSIAAFELGLLYGRQQMWDSSFAVYHRLMYSYRPVADTVLGYDLNWLKIPLEISEMYRLLGRQENAGDWLDSALVFYGRLIDEYPTGTVNAIAKTYAANTHQLQGDFHAAIAVLRTIIDSTGLILPQAKVEIGNIFLERLGQPDSAEAVYKELVVRRPDSPGATIAQTKIAAILIEQGKYQEARDLLRPLKQAYEKRGQLIAGIQLLMGRTYEEEGAWDRALNEYSWLVENFPELKQSLDVYIHVIARMVEMGNSTVARQWQNNAQQHFDKIIAENPNTELAAAAQKNLARSHVLLQQWEPAAVAYQTLLDIYPAVPAHLDIYLELSIVYADRLNDDERGASILERMLADFPTFKRRDEIQQRIDYLRSGRS